MRFFRFIITFKVQRELNLRNCKILAQIDTLNLVLATGCERDERSTCTTNVDLSRAFRERASLKSFRWRFAEIYEISILRKNARSRNKDKGLSGKRSKSDRFCAAPLTSVRLSRVATRIRFPD